MSRQERVNEILERKTQFLSNLARGVLSMLGKE